MSDDTIQIDTRQTFHSALQWAMSAADARSARVLYWVDPDFADWPLDDDEWIDSLTAWLRRPQRRLVMLANDFDALARSHPRFTAWRSIWSHVVDARRPDPDAVGELPTLLLDDGPVVLQLHDRLHWRGRAASDPAAAKACRDTVEVLLQRSEAAWPVNPLGL